MTSRRITAVIRAQHGSCCLTNSYRDHGCTIGVRGLDRNGLVTIHGDKHQKQHGIKGKLCDRLILGDGDKAFLCSVELKGGKNVRVSEAIEQIQRGLDLAIDLLDSDPDWDWYPLLAYRDGITRMGTKKLSQNPDPQIHWLVSGLTCMVSLKSSGGTVWRNRRR